jgi:hypothetical protein
LILHFIVIVEVLIQDLGEQEEIDVAGDLVTTRINGLRVHFAWILTGPMTFSLASAQPWEGTIHQTIAQAGGGHGVSILGGHCKSTLYI